MIKKQGIILCLIATLVMDVFADTWVLPWVANKDDAWASEIVVNNHSTSAVSIGLKAVRPSGETEEVTGITIPANGQVSMEAGQTFQTLGSGSGYAVFITGENLNITSAVKVKSLATASGDSPALGYGIRLEEGATSISFQSLPYSQGGAAAPVIVNLGDVTANIQLFLYGQNGSLVGTPKEMTLSPKTPFADVIANMFPESNSDSYLIVKSDQPIAGMSFNFNTIREPSMMNAEPVMSEFTEEDLAALISTLETTSTLSSAYTQATSGIFSGKAQDKASASCPEVDVQVNLNNSDSFIHALFDWGGGCTNVFGMYSKGSIGLDMVREGKLTEAAWMNGTMAFDGYEVKYLATDFALDGYLHMEGSVRSDNFTLNGEWKASAVSPFYGVHASYDSSSFLNINKKSDNYEVYGYISVHASQYYYFSMDGQISQVDPLIYDYDTCPWPTSGKISLTINWGYPVSGYMDFGTGDCNTARVNIAGVETLLYLPGIYTKN